MSMQVRDAAEGFCRREHPRLVASMTVYSRDRELAQEALARALRDWRRLEQLAAPGACTHRIAVKLAHSYLRRRRCERASRASAPSGAPAGPAPAEPALGAELRRALLGLPRRQREALVLRFLLDLTVAATAERMGCAAGTVRALTAQGVARLRQDPALAELGEPDHD